MHLKPQNLVLPAALSILFCVYPAQSTPLPATTYVVATGKPAESTKEVPAQTEEVVDCPVLIQLNIQMKNSYEKGHTRDYFAAYPYPVKPPAVTKWPEPLSTKSKDIQSRLFASGYAARTDYKPYIQFGWRWEYCYRAAVRQAGGEMPHVIFFANSWVHDMAKYILPEIKRMNELEENRHDFYDAMTQEVEEHGAELEDEAAKNNLTPLVLHLDKQRKCATKLAAGKWWIVGTHKVPGLTYYWELPITVAAGQPNEIQLTEANAIVILGSW